MLDDKSQAEVNAASCTILIIVLGLCGGIIVLGVCILAFRQPPQVPTTNIFTYLSLGFAGLETLMCVVVPRVMVSANRKQIAAGTWNLQGREAPNICTDAGRLAAVYQTTTIIGCGLLEGAAFFALIAYMLEGHVATLVVAVLMLIGVAAHLPLGDRITVWVENQLQIIEDDRRFLR